MVWSLDRGRNDTISLSSYYIRDLRIPIFPYKMVMNQQIIRAVGKVSKVGNEVVNGLANIFESGES